MRSTTRTPTVGEAAREALRPPPRAEDSRPTREELELLDRMIAWARARGRDRGRAHHAAARLGERRQPAAMERRARDRVHRVPRHAALAAGAAGRARDRRQARRAAGRHDRRGRARADQEPVAGAARGLSRSACCSRPTPPRRASSCSATATCSCTPRFRGTRTGSSSATAASTATARRRPRCSSITSSARAGRRRRRGSLEGDLDFLARVVRKVEQIRDDLGSAGPVIARQIEEAMLGRRTALDDSRTDGHQARRCAARVRAADARAAGRAAR